jgi:hypothetical protein
MARRGGRKGDYLITDDYTGFTTYSSKVHLDFWGALAKKPLLRNLQEIASPLADPYPVNPYRGPNYESVNPLTTTVAPTFVGKTNVKTSHDNAAFESGAVT